MGRLEHVSGSTICTLHAIRGIKSMLGCIDIGIKMGPWHYLEMVEISAALMIFMFILGMKLHYINHVPAAYCIPGRS